jgi:hypothetical protein
MAMQKVWVKGKDVAVGDVIDFLGKEYEVTRFEAHPGLNHCGNLLTARVALSEWEDGEGETHRWGITIFDEDPSDVLREVPDRAVVGFADLLAGLVGK